MKQLRRKSDQIIKYTPMVPKTENGKTVLVKVGRPLTAANEQELRKKMQNRVSAIEARMRKKRRLEELEEKVETLTKENERLRSENARLSCNAIDWNNKHHHRNNDDKTEKSAAFMPTFSPSASTSSTKEEQGTNFSFPAFGQPAYQAENYYPAGFSNPTYHAAYTPVASPATQPTLTNRETLKSLLSSPQAPPVTVPKPASTQSVAPLPSYSTYNPHPTYDSCEFDFANFMPSF